MLPFTRNPYERPTTNSLTSFLSPPWIVVFPRFPARCGWPNERCCPKPSPFACFVRCMVATRSSKANRPRWAMVHGSRIWPNWPPSLGTNYSGNAVSTIHYSQSPPLPTHFQNSVLRTKHVPPCANSGGSGHDLFCPLHSFVPPSFVPHPFVSH